MYIHTHTHTHTCRKSYRLLSGDKRLRGDSVFASVGGVPVKLGPIGVRINVDSIALDR